MPHQNFVFSNWRIRNLVPLIVGMLIIILAVATNGQSQAVSTNFSYVSSFTGVTASDLAGWDVTFVGDVNKDGFGDLLIGAPENNKGGMRAGAAYLIFGSANMPSQLMPLTQANVTFIGSQSREETGMKVAGVGDVNGDGFSDFLIAAPMENNGTGKVYLIFGKSNDWQVEVNLSEADASFVGEGLGDNAGFSIASAGDINNDGLNDFLIGSPRYDNQVNDIGKTYLILGKATGWSKNTILTNAEASFVGESALDLFGLSVAGVGDINHDGYDDIAIGAPNHNENGKADNGKVYLFWGRGGSWNTNMSAAGADAALIGDNSNDLLGKYISNSGDINGDSIKDFLVTASLTNSAGKIYLIFGRSSGWNQNMLPETFAPSFIGANANDCAGVPTMLRDLNSDGFNDLLIAATKHGPAGNQAGKIYYIPGKATNWNQNTSLAMSDVFMVGENAQDYAGQGLASGDFDHDGFPDVAIGAPGNNTSAEDAGIVYLFHSPFKPVSASLTLMSPNGAENWAVGSEQHVTWSSEGNISNVKIKYSTDNGISWKIIVENTPNDGDYLWTIPDDPSATCLVRIEDAVDGIPSDKSDNLFTIYKPISENIGVISPNGGECWLSGTEHEISWNSAGSITNVKIQYTIDGGEHWITITNSTPNDGSFMWTVPQAHSSNCLIKIADLDCNPEDISNAPFTIWGKAPVAVIAPDGGECLKPGQQFKIKWEACCCIDSVKIQYSLNGGGSWNLIVKSTPNDSSYVWTVPAVHSTNCLIKVADLDCNPEDVSNAPFTIWNKAPITVISPNGGECLLKGQRFEIKWEASCYFSSLKIQYSINGGKDWTTIVNGTENDGKYLWTVPNVHSDSCLIKVADLDCDPQDVSDSLFTIWGKAPITVLSPNGGECLRPGQRVEIIWEACCCLDSLKIQYSTDGGEDWNMIVYGTENDGCYIWTVPNVHSDNCLIKVADLDCDPEDISDEPFTIWGKAPIAVVSPNGGECLQSGMQFEIKWEASCCLDSLKIQYSIDNGKNWTTIIYGTENDSSHFWKIPEVNSDSCLIKVADLDCDPEDVSDSVFTICKPPFITVLRPNGGETLEAGQGYKIKWYACCFIDTVKIQYSIDGGQNWLNIVYRTKNDSSYVWRVPNTPSISCLIKVADIDCDPFDISDSLFTIVSAAMADFDATIMTGSEPLEVRYINLSTGNISMWHWNFGDGQSSENKEPIHIYTEPGLYTVKLTAYYPGWIDSVIKRDFVHVYAKESFAQLEVANSTPTLPQNDWTNAIDGDICGWDGTTVLEGEKAEIIFSLNDSCMQEVNGVGLITDTGIGYEDRWIRHFQIQLSSTGIETNDFQTILDTVMSAGNLEVFPIPATRAKFIKLIALAPQNNLLHLGEFEVFLGATTTIKGENQALTIPDEFRLSQNYPNPFNPTTIIKFEIPKAGHVKLEIYNLLGENIRTLINGNKDAGIYEIKWDGKNKDGITMPSGIYLYILSTNEHREVRKMIMTK